MAALILIAMAQGDSSLWADAPGAHSRNNVWHTTVNVPPFEEARVAPPGTLAARVWFDASRGDFRESDEGGRSTWENLAVEELLQVDYGLAPGWQAGLRLSSGSVRERRSTDVTVFDGGALVTHDLEGAFEVGSLVLRGKFAAAWQDFGDWAVLAEVKVPLGGRRNVLDAGTVDVGLALCATKRLEDGFAIHAQVGLVAPLGETEFFTTDEDPSIAFTYAIGVTWRAYRSLTIFAQGEGNTGAFRMFKEIDHSVATAGMGARLDLGNG